MPLQKQLVPIEIAAGLDSKTDPQRVQPGKLLELVNAEFTKQGALYKRSGYDILPKAIEGGGSISAAAAISSYQGELLLFSGTRVYSWMEATQTWVDRGIAVSVTVSERIIRRTNDTQQLNPDVGVLNGIEVYAWEDESGAVMYSVLDSATGAFAVSNGTIAAAAIKPRIVPFGRLLYVFYTDGINNLIYRTINPSEPTVLGTENFVAGDMAAYGGYDVFPSDVVGNMYIAYLSATPSIVVMSLAADMSLSATDIPATGALASDGAHSAIDVFFNLDHETVWVSWSTGTDVREAVYDVALALQTTFQVLPIANCPALAGTDSATPGELLLFIEVTASNPSDEHITFLDVSDSGSTSGQRSVRCVGLASKPIVYNGVRYVNVTHQSVLQNTYFTLYVDDPSLPIVAKSQPSLGAGLRTNGMLSSSPAVGATQYTYANGVRGRILSEANTVFSLPGVASATLDFASVNRFLSATQSGENFLVGGVLNSYDGVTFTEHLFHLYPEDVTAVPAGADGFLSTGSYQYVAVYEWTDNYGQIQRSATSIPVTASVTALNHVTVTVPTLRLTAKRGARHPPSIVIYRTTANGSLFFRATDTLAPVLNDPFVNFITFVDVLSDADIQGNEIVYTTGGVLNNIAPPASTFISLFQGRVVLGGLADPNVLWFSKNKFDNTNANTLPVEFAQELTIGVDARGGGITSIGLLDDKLIIFKQSSIFAVAGDGPNDTGGGVPFSDAQLITTDVGCNNANSVVVTPVGIMFQSDKGIYMLDRSVQSQYIGAPVEAFNDLTIASATLNQDSNKVIFTTNSDTALVYDYYFQQWSTWTNHEAVDSDIFEGKFAFAKSNGDVYMTNSTKFTDGGKAIYMSWTTPNIALSGLSGYQRIFKAFLLGSFKSPHRLNVSVAYDYSPVYTQSVTIDATAAGTTWGSDPTWGDLGTVWGGTFSPYQFRVDMARQRCTAVRIKVADTQDLPYGEGYSMAGLTLEVGQMPGGNRLPQSQVVGTR